MKALRMTLLISLTFATLMTLAATGEKQIFKLKYLSEVTKGKVLLTIPVEAHDPNEAQVLANKKCVSGLMDLSLSREDIVDMCNNPRL